MIGRTADIYFAYIGDNVFIPIERLDMSLLNRVVQQVPLGDTLCVKPKRGHKKKSVTSTEETMTGVTERKKGRGKQKANELEAKIVESASSEPKRRGRKQKKNNDTLKPKIDDVVKGKKRDRICRGIMRIHRSPSRPRPSVRPTAALINIHEHLI